MFDKKFVTILSVLVGVIVVGTITVVLVGEKRPEQIIPPVVDNSDTNIPVSENVDNWKEPEVITSDIDTSGWLLYEDYKFDFSIQYPKDWYITGWYNDEKKQNIHLSPSPLGPNNDYGIYVNIYENTDNLRYKAAVNSIIDTWKYKPVELKRIILGMDEVLQSGNLTFFVNDKHIFVVNFIPAGEISSDVYDIFLLSFKVFNNFAKTKPKEIKTDINTNQWQQFNNENFGITLRYPNGWHSTINNQDGIFQFRPTESPVDAPIITLSLLKDKYIKNGSPIMNYESLVDEFMKNTFMDKQWITVNGKQLIQYQSVFPNNKSRITFIIVNNHLWSLNIGDSQDISVDTYNTILKTIGI